MLQNKTTTNKPPQKEPNNKPKVEQKCQYYFRLGELCCAIVDETIKLISTHMLIYL